MSKSRYQMMAMSPSQSCQYWLQNLWKAISIARAQHPHTHANHSYLPYSQNCADDVLHRLSDHLAPSNGKDIYQHLLMA